MADLTPLTDEEREELIAYLDGELDPHATQALEKKLGADARIQAELDSLRRTWNLLDFLPKPEPSPNFTQRTVSSVLPARQVGPPPQPLVSRPTWQRLGWAAALLLTGLTGYGATAFVASQRTPRLRETAEVEQIARDLRVLEQLGLYQYASDLQFLNELDRPELFGEE